MATFETRPENLLRFLATITNKSGQNTELGGLKNTIYFDKFC